MFDFLEIEARKKKNEVEICPSFIIKKSKDLMVRGRDFYAFWDEQTGFWSTDEELLISRIDTELRNFAEEYSKTHVDDRLIVRYMRKSENPGMDEWRKYTTKHMRDNYHPLDESIIFSNQEITKDTYATRTLNYPLAEGDYSSYDELISTLYSPEERQKIEWTIGCIVSGDSTWVQKFLVLYGSSGTGKSTIINVIQMLFDGYWKAFDSRVLGQANAAFALEAFSSNPLIAIQHDGDLSRIEDNTRLNSIVSHESMNINEKFKALYSMQFKSFLIMGTNRPVKITDSKSGILRRLIDVSPSGNLIPQGRYWKLMERIKFELGAIAYHCLQFYNDNKNLYNNYIPVKMMDESNSFYNFIDEWGVRFESEEFVTLKQAYMDYKVYCEESGVQYPYSKILFKAELKSYFNDFYEQYRVDGEKYKNVYVGFISDKYTAKEPPQSLPALGLKFEEQPSLIDELYKDCKAQYASEEGTPINKWSNVRSTLKDLDTSKLHYILFPPELKNHIVIDFDKKTEDGRKSFKKNVEAANKWPPTYAELSKSGEGIHLHYIYDGDVSKLAGIVEEDIEIKVFNGNSSLRRQLSKCNNIPIRTINSGLPLKGEKKMLNFENIKSERQLRNMIMKGLRREVHTNTKPSVDYIYMVLEKAYNEGLVYDVSDMRNAVLNFCLKSTHQSDNCLKVFNKMHFMSDVTSTGEGKPAMDDIIFYDVEVYPNLFVVCWMTDTGTPVKMINPTAAEVESLFKFKLVGFNCRRYDNHIMYAAAMGYNNAELFRLSQSIIDAEKGAKNAGFFREAYNLSYTDVYDFASASNKMSLKKLEILMGIHHLEMGLPWDKPVPEELWDKVADYCCNDVIATKAGFHYLEADWIARQILADVAGLTVNDTTNNLTTKIIFEDNRKPQAEFHVRNLAEPVMSLDPEVKKFLNFAKPKMMSHWKNFHTSLLPYFPGYNFTNGKSTYKWVDGSKENGYVGEGGRVAAQPGIYYNVALLDVNSMHPNSAIAECFFGPRFTRRFWDIVNGRVAIKHEQWDELNAILEGKLTKWVQKVKDGTLSSKALANGLKTAINSVYGLTSAKFDNPFNHPLNIDNIVAKRGALFMIDLEEAVRAKGYTVVHIKTDSIKIADATPEIISFVMEFGEKYGYVFEHEATYSKICLVNDAVYIAQYADPEWCQGTYNYIPGDNAKYGGKWTATGTQFAVPYVFKTLFSGEAIEFSDLCETKSVSTSLYLEYDDGTRQFVGKVGLFCPVRSGPRLVAERVIKDTGEVKYDSVTGAKDYRWLESEDVRNRGIEQEIDMEYYISLADKARDAIQTYGDFEIFVNEPAPPITPHFMVVPEAPEGSEGVPWD